MMPTKTPGVVVSEIIMTRVNFTGIFFLVEGDDDSKFWRARLSKEKSRITICTGKTTLLEVASRTTATDTDIVGAYDRDHDEIFQIRHHPEHLSVTDENDLELTLLESEALDRVLGELGSATKIALFEATENMSVKQYLQKVSQNFGKLRYLNRLHSHGVNFDLLSPYRLISPTTWTLDLDSLNELYSNLSGLPRNLLDSELQQCPESSKWNFSQGHDALRILAQGLKSRIGDRHNCDEAQILTALRLTYRPEELFSTNMWQHLKQIETTRTCRFTS